jgi:hypothetical protein
MIVPIKSDKGCEACLYDGTSCTRNKKITELLSRWGFHTPKLKKIVLGGRYPQHRAINCNSDSFVWKNIKEGVQAPEPYKTHNELPLTPEQRKLNKHIDTEERYKDYYFMTT